MSVIVKDLHDGYALLEVLHPGSGVCSETEARVRDWLKVLVDIGAWAKPGEDVSFGGGREPWVGPIPLALAEAVAPSLRTMLTAHGCQEATA